MTRRKLPRRQFLQGSLAAASVAGLGGGTLSAASWSRVLGSNEDLRMGIVGLNGRGGGLMNGFHNASGSRVVALCDVDKKVLDKRSVEMSKKGVVASQYRDIRNMLDSRNLDALAIATPNHWHALMTIWGCQAGKDVYCEKPVSHNVWEGRQAAAAARHYERVVATGTQSRSSAGIRAAIEYVHSGALGAIRVARGLCYKSRPSIGHVRGPQPLPRHIDYDLWSGPAEMEPLMRKRLHYDWHWTWNCGNGDIGNQGIHQMDVARWALGAKSISKRCLSVGGRFGYIDDGQTPNTQVAVHEFDEGVLTFEVRGLYKSNGNVQQEGFRGQKIGNIIECEKGYVSLDTNRGRAYDWDGKELAVFEPGRGHVATHIDNFLLAVRDRNPAALNSDIEEGHISSALCHIGNISHRLGQRSSLAEIEEHLQSHKAFARAQAGDTISESFQRLREHLVERKVDLDQVVPSLGMPLEMDPLSERFLNNPTADLMLARNYREPFVVPELHQPTPAPAAGR